MTEAIATNAIGIDPKSMEGILFAQIFGGLSIKEALEKAKMLVSDFLSNNNDPGLEKTIGILDALFDSYSKTDSAVLEKLHFFRDTYTRLPEDYGLFPQTRIGIIRIICKLWDRMITPVTMDAFSFLCSVYQPPSNGSKQELSATESVLKGRPWFREERSEIDAAFRRILGRDKNVFTPNLIRAWLRKRPGMPPIPDELKKIFEINWVRLGGRLDDLFRLNDAIGQDLPDGAHAILRKTAKQLRKTDFFLEAFLSKAGIQDKKLNVSWGIPGSASCRINAPTLVTLSIALDHAPPGTGAILARPIERLKEAYHGISNANVSINVRIVVKGSRENPSGIPLDHFTLEPLSSK